VQGIIQQIGAESAQANISTSSSVITAQSVCVLGMSYSQILPFHKVIQSLKLQLKRLSTGCIKKKVIELQRAIVSELLCA
jgi:hypothetical protein